MKALWHDGVNLQLTLPGAGEDRTLPAQRIKAYDPELGQTEEEAHDAILTLWNPDDGERRALANGAPIELVVTGTAHPPVSMGVGEPVEREAQLGRQHTDRAVGYLFSKLSDAMAAGEFPDGPACLALWGEALSETAEDQPLDLGAKLDEAREALEETQKPNGNGDDPDPDIAA